MTAKEFYGPSFSLMCRAKDQVLDVVEQGKRAWEGQRPVLYTSARIKSPSSMCRKLAQRGLPQTRQAALSQIRDGIGVRVICAFHSDVYRMARWLEERPEFVVLETNGYRSYHLILGIRAGQGKGMTVEVQLRTIATDFWASLEHQMKYKKKVPHEGLIREELKRCADEIASVDLSMETIRELLAGGFA